MTEEDKIIAEYTQRSRIEERAKIMAHRKAQRKTDLVSQAANVQEPFITSKQAAAFLRISVPALYVAIRRGQVPAYRFGLRRIRFRKSELINSINSNKIVPTLPKL